jgi:thioredoxin-dependent peroxiredoxin
MTHLKEGDKAPAFSAPDQNGKLISLSQYFGKKLILFFYPKDNTPGCTAEACSLRDHYADLVKQGFEVIGVSIDNTRSHKNFESKYALPYTLLADDEKRIVNAYGVWGEKKMYGRTYEGTHRTTFVINEKGIIRLILEKVDTKAHAEQILKELDK